MSLARLSLGLLALRVGEASARLGQHLELVLVHVDGIGPSGLGLRVGVDLAGLELARIVVLVVELRGRRALERLLLRLVEQVLVALEALGGRAAHDGRNGAPLSRHELGHVQELFVLFATPLGLLDARIEPLEPARLALLRRLAMQQRGNTRPLVLAVLHHGRLEDLILGVAPHAALDCNADHFSCSSSSSSLSSSSSPSLYLFGDLIVQVVFINCIFLSRRRQHNSM